MWIIITQLFMLIFVQQTLFGMLSFTAQPLSPAEVACIQYLVSSEITVQNNSIAQSTNTHSFLQTQANAGMLRTYRKKIEQIITVEAEIASAPCSSILKQARTEKDDTILRLLLAIEATLTLNTTAVHEAVKQNKLETVTYLIEHGARVNKKDAANKLPYQYATEYNYTNMSALLSHYLGYTEIKHCIRHSLPSCTII